MIKKLSKYGNSLAVLIDKPILEILNIDEKTKLKISTDGENIIIKPMRKGKKSKNDSIDLKKLYEELIKEHGEAFKKLAE